MYRLSDVDLSVRAAVRQVLERAREKRLVTVKEAVERFEVAESTVLRLLRRGIVYGVKLGAGVGVERRQWLVDPRDVAAWATLDRSGRQQVGKGNMSLAEAAGISLPLRETVLLSQDFEPVAEWYCQGTLAKGG